MGEKNNMKAEKKKINIGYVNFLKDVEKKRIVITIFIQIRT